MRYSKKEDTLTRCTRRRTGVACFWYKKTKEKIPRAGTGDRTRRRAARARRPLRRLHIGGLDTAGCVRDDNSKSAPGWDRATGHGVIDAYIHPARPLGALIELGCETDFVARTGEFRTLAHEIAMHVAAMAPQKIATDDDGEGEALLEQAYVRDPGQTIDELIQETVARTGENIRVVRISRFEVGA